MLYTQQELSQINARYKDIERKLRLSKLKDGAIRDELLLGKLPEHLLEVKTLVDIENDEFAFNKEFVRLTMEILKNYGQVNIFKKKLLDENLMRFYVVNYPAILLESKLLLKPDNLTLYNCVLRLYNKQLSQLHPFVPPAPPVPFVMPPINFPPFVMPPIVMPPIVMPPMPPINVHVTTSGVPSTPVITTAPSAPPPLSPSDFAPLTTTGANAIIDELTRVIAFFQNMASTTTDPTALTQINDLIQFHQDFLAYFSSANNKTLYIDNAMGGMTPLEFYDNLKQFI